ncbi:pectate lyase [Catellatospora sp. NPDC049111]|uniref:pectate lyase n=1 Tax=Catellatospora sp. NPDC049111 TaxID=3155271 RepID=UPI0033F1FDFA
MQTFPTARKRRPRLRLTLAMATVATVVGGVALAAMMPASAATIDTSAYYQLVNVFSGKAIEGSGGAVVQRTSDGSASNQQFQFLDMGSGYYRLKSKASGKVIEIAGSSTADGATVQMASGAGSTAYYQQFSLLDNGNNVVRFKNRNSGKSLDVWEWSSADGARISQYQDLNGTNQQFRLVKVGSGGNPTPAPSPTGGSGGPSTTWPSSAGSVSISGTISVSGTFDGGMKTYCCIGDGGQGESQDPMFKLANGATLQNVILGSPAGDGVHCEGTCTLRNVWWNDIGEDAATFKGTGGGTSYVIGGGARSGSDKVFQHNGNGTVSISNFYLKSAGKLYRACGNCSSSYQRNVKIDNVILDDIDMVAGINSNWGDIATITRVTLINSSSATVCGKYKGVPKGSEPSYLGEGWNDSNCKVKESDITYR